MIRKSGRRFSEKIMLNRESEGDGCCLQQPSRFSQSSCDWPVAASRL